ncbi:MAG: hypothetical protein ACKO37_02130 [Vampirovibrionales bacterium]
MSILLKSVYLANVLVAGFVGISTLWFPSFSAVHVLQGCSDANPPYTSLRIVGALWCSIALISLLGVWLNPFTYSVVLLVQLLYKGGWLLVVALPRYLKREGESLPLGMTIFFILWVIVLPWVIPYRALGLAH